MAETAAKNTGRRKTGKTVGGILLPYQRRWIQDESPTKLGDKSRRTGWTWAEAYDAVSRRFRGTQPTPRDYWFSSADESAAYEFIQYCAFFARELFGRIADQFTEEIEDKDTRKGTVNSFVIRCPNGKRITAMSSNPRRFRSKGGDVRCDEFAFHDDAEGMNDAASPCTMWGGTYAVWSTPNGELSVFNRFVQNCRKVLKALGHDPDAPPATIDYRAVQAKALEMSVTPIFSYHRVTIIDAIDQGIVEKINSASGQSHTHDEFLANCRAKSRGEDAFQQEYMCVASADAMAWLPYALIQACEDDAVPQPGEGWKNYQGGPLYIGYDVGRIKDLSIVAIAEYVGDVLWPRCILSMKNVSTAEQVAALRAAVANKRVTRICVDYTGVGVGVGDLLTDTFGANIVEKINFSAKTMEPMAVGLKCALEDRTVRLPVSQKFRDGLHKIRKTTTASGNIRFVAPRDEEGHADEFWGTALMIEAAGKQHQLPKPIFTPIHESDWGCRW